MRVFVRYFARTRELTGRGSEHISLPEGSDIGSLISVIEKKYSLSLKGYPLFFSVNQEYGGPDTKLSDGDEVALLYPPSGG